MVPNFLVENSYNNISKADIYNSLILISEFMKKIFLFLIVLIFQYPDLILLTTLNNYLRILSK